MYGKKCISRLVLELVDIAQVLLEPSSPLIERLGGRFRIVELSLAVSEHLLLVVGLRNVTG
jgi:hypothetical protein